MSITSFNSFNGKIQVHGVGKVEWIVEDTKSVKKPIRITVLYMPSAGVCLFSLQTLWRSSKEPLCSVVNNCRDL